METTRYRSQDVRHTGESLKVTFFGFTSSSVTSAFFSVIRTLDSSNSTASSSGDVISELVNEGASFLRSKFVRKLL